MSLVFNKCNKYYRNSLDAANISPLIIFIRALSEYNTKKLRMFGSKSGTRTHTKIEKTKCSGRMIPGPFTGTPRTNRLSTGNNRRPVWSWPRRCPSSTL